MNISFNNLNNQAQNATSTLSLSILFTHPVNKSQAQAEAYVVAALTDFAQANNLDIYERDEDDQRTATVDEDLLITAIEEHLRRQILLTVIARRGDLAQAEARVTAQETLGA
ncbi:MAG TPA: hypothetical protein PLD20_26470 [Blastocatellia bacterium]|nr:hypothetical protein [Blastocatellia bacterium]HMX28108.1 hypothetical protein [Blastocatellia bacterium]HMY70304.1 hypothetical protein [Blastocatellia bacterium]HMZ21506.1 hypothetical protein [Blastocatellia bacterium]HNG31814.1 hypothetical protein [Blastocatellia bacterium]